MENWKERFDEIFGEYWTKVGDKLYQAFPYAPETTPILIPREGIINFIDQIISERDKEVIKMLENTDVQMSVNGDVSQDEIAMAKFIYKAHINHIIKKIGSAIIPPNSINGTLPSETDSAIK